MRSCIVLEYNFIETQAWLVSRTIIELSVAEDRAIHKMVLQCSVSYLQYNRASCWRVLQMYHVFKMAMCSIKHHIDTQQSRNIYMYRTPRTQLIDRILHFMQIQAHNFLSKGASRTLWNSDNDNIFLSTY